jgi:hypothetical protein
MLLHHITKNSKDKDRDFFLNNYNKMTINHSQECVLL